MLFRRPSRIGRRLQSELLELRGGQGQERLPVRLQGAGSQRAERLTKPNLCTLDVGKPVLVALPLGLEERLLAGARLREAAQLGRLSLQRAPGGLEIGVAVPDDPLQADHLALRDISLRLQRGGGQRGGLTAPGKRDQPDAQGPDERPGSCGDQ